MRRKVGRSTLRLRGRGKGYRGGAEKSFIKKKKHAIAGQRRGGGAHQYVWRILTV